MIRNYNNDILSGILFLSKNLNNNFVLKKDDASNIVVGAASKRSRLFIKHLHKKQWSKWQRMADCQYRASEKGLK